MGLSIVPNSAIAQALAAAPTIQSIIARNRGMASPMPAGGQDALAAAVAAKGMPQDASTDGMPAPTVIQAPPDAYAGMSGGSPGSGTIGAIGSSGAPLNDQFAQALMQKAMNGGPMYSPWDVAGRLAMEGVGNYKENQYLQSQKDAISQAATTLSSGDQSAWAKLASSNNPEVAKMALSQIATQADPLHRLQVQSAQQQYDMRRQMMNDPDFTGTMSPQPPPAGGMASPSPSGGPPTSGALPPGSPSPQALQQQATADIASASAPKPLVDITSLQRRADYYTRWAPIVGGDEGKTMLEAANSINGRINNMVTSGLAPGTNGGVVPIPGAGYTPLISPQDRAASNIDPADTRTAFRDPKGLVSFPGQPTTSIVNNAETSQAAKMGGIYGDMQKTILDASQSANDNLANIAYAKQLLELTPTGFGAGQLAQLQNIGRSLGLPDSVIGNAGPAEALQAVSNQLALNLRNPSLGAGMPGSLSNSDRDFLTQGVVGLDKVPGGNALIMDLAEKKAQRALAIEQMREDYANAHQGNIDANFIGQVNAFNRSNPIFGPDDVKRVMAAKAGAAATTPQGPSPTSGPVTITNDDDYNRLPSGTIFVGPDGKSRKKP